MRHLAVVLGLAIAFFVRSAAACQCSMPSAEDARQSAKVIVEGRVESNLPRKDKGFSGMNRVRIADAKFHRGSGGQSLELDNGGDCQAAALEPSTRYLIYLTADPAAQGTAISVCTRIVRSHDAAAELAELTGTSEPASSDTSTDTSTPSTEPTPKPSAAPSSPAPPPAQTGGCASCAIGSDTGPSPLSNAMTALFLLGIGVGLARRSRVT